MEEEIEDLDSTTEDDQTEDLEITSDDSSDEEIEDVEALKEKNTNLYARAKKAEAELKKLKNQPKPEKKESVQPTREEILKVLDERELDSLDFGDELKKEVQNYAKISGVSIKKALSSDYIVFLKEKIEKKQRAEDASLGNKSRATVKRDYSTYNPGESDLRTPEGKADFAKWEDHVRKELG